MTEDGQCLDEMNRNVWQASKCNACKGGVVAWANKLPYTVLPGWSIHDLAIGHVMQVIFNVVMNQVTVK